jgi:hypothetical protein
MWPNLVIGIHLCNYCNSMHFLNAVYCTLTFYISCIAGSVGCSAFAVRRCQYSCLCALISSSESIAQL